MLCLIQAQKDAGECHIKIPVITFDSPEEEGQQGEDGREAEGEEEVEIAEEAMVSEEEDATATLRQTTSQSQEFHLCRETVSSEGSDADQKPGALPSPQLTNDNSSSGIDVRSHLDDTDPLEPNADVHGFLRLPLALARYGPGGRTHIRGLSMDSGKDAVLLSDRAQNTVRRLPFSVSLPFVPGVRVRVSPTSPSR